MDRQRVVELTFGGLSAGSGYLLTDRHVLTARHVIKPEQKGAQCTIAPLLENPTKEGQAKWLSNSADLAIVEAGDGWLGLPPPPSVFGVVPNTSLRLCSAIGFPAASMPREHLITATVDLIVRGGARLNLSVDDALPSNPEWWRGFSGALVFSGPLPIGVVQEVVLNFAGLLTATPLDLLIQDGEFQAYWREQNLPFPQMRHANPMTVSAASEIASKVFQIDRDLPVKEVITALRDLRAIDKRMPTIVMVPGLDYDEHLFFMSQIALHPTVQTLVGNAGRAEDVIIGLPWPDQSTSIDPEDEFQLIIARLRNVLFLEPTDAPLDTKELRQALNLPESPKAFYVLVRQAVAMGGYGRLLCRLVDLWGSLDVGEPLVLFVCLALDKPVAMPKRRRPLMGTLARSQPILQAEDLAAALADHLRAGAEQKRATSLVLDELSLIEVPHIDSWISRVRPECRLVAPEQWASLRMGLASRLTRKRRLREVSNAISNLLKL